MPLNVNTYCVLNIVTKKISEKLTLMPTTEQNLIKGDNITFLVTCILP